ncbi:VWA domain-containing protein [Pseudomonas sp. R5(2019)]|uniref:vWA domain-containing protein n=1 Tax=Pseudomonas sp. R5(2019) TaxID=2697566 RepID=UPI001412A654|nr:VWA domain-containing protein [Pseudomonas sp. R5(2019)]NBA98171.1 VWA domain-containing protein [Pseudomonas sp. R5(2019)]
MDARPRVGQLDKGAHGRARAAREGSVDWLATLFGGRPRCAADLRWRTRKAAPQQLWLVIVDASASTRRHQALSQAKGLLVQLFDLAYRSRARLALLTASGRQPQWQRHGLKASAALRPWLDGLGAGGGTPLIEALEQAREWLCIRQKSHGTEQRRCIVLTDGRIKAWQTLQSLGCPTVVVDIESGPIRLGRARQLAEQLLADYRHLDSL